VSSSLDSHLVDHLIELYCAWREECEAVRRAYRRLDEAESGDRLLAFATYTAALDREGAAAQLYGIQVRRVSAMAITPPEHAGPAAGGPAAAAAPHA
jgi:hypothetical protein